MQFRNLAIRIVLVCWLLGVSATAWPQVLQAPSDAQLRRFIVAYRAHEAPLRIALLAARAQEERGQAEQARYLRCVATSFTPDTFADALVPLARQEFPSAERLAAITKFFESPTGQRVVQQVIAALPGSTSITPDNRASISLRPEDFRFSAEEELEVRTFQETDAYLDFKAFGRRIRSVLVRESSFPEFAAVQGSCRK